MEKITAFFIALIAAVAVMAAWMGIMAAMAMGTGFYIKTIAVPVFLAATVGGKVYRAMAEAKPGEQSSIERINSDNYYKDNPW